MKRQHVVPWLVLSLSFLMCGPPAGFAVENRKPIPIKSPPPIARPPAEAVAKLAQSSNAFGFDLYQRLRQKPGNLVISPASLTTALTMAWIGAEEETAEQMRTVLHPESTGSRKSRARSTRRSSTRSRAP
jgi:serine protease inhibitor